MIWIVGTGAVGLFFAAKLSLKSPVTVIGRSAESVKPWWAGVEVDDWVAHPEVKGWEELDAIPSGATVVIATKAYQVQAALGELAKKSDLGSLHLIFLQNGLKIIEAALNTYSTIDIENTTRAATWLGVRRVGTRLILSGLQGVECAGGPSQKLESWVESLKQAGIPAKVTSHRQTLEWQKALSNLVINGLCTLAQVPNRGIVEDPGLRQHAERALDEAFILAQAEGIELTPSDRKRVFEIAEITGDNLNSMLMDLKSGHLTEVAWLNGAVVRMARKHGIQVPTHQMIDVLITRLQEKVENLRG